MSTEVQAESSAAAAERAHKVKKVKKSKADAAATTAPAVAPTDGVDEESEKRPRKEQEDDGTLLEVDVELPAPLSKAEARAARKRAKKAEEAGLPDPSSTDAAAKGKGKEKEKIEQVKRQNSVWIGNLSYRTTVERVKEFFLKGVAQLGGDEESVTRIHMPTKPGHGGFADNKGFAYVDFTSPENQELAVQLSEKLIEGRKVLIKRGDDFKADPNARTPKPAHIPGIGKQTRPESSTLFVGNLPFDATEEALRDLIEENAETPEPTEDTEDQKVRQDGGRGGKKSGLRKVRLGAFEDTGRCKGFAFLDFYSPAQATKTLANRKVRFFNGRRLQLEYASEEATKRSGGGSRDKRPRTQGAEDGDKGEDARPKRSRNDAEFKPKKDFGARETEGGLGELEIARIAVAQSFDGAPHAETAGRETRPKGDKRGKKWEATGRPRPGAALAMAKREKVSIVTGGQQGNKITFD